MYFKDLIGILFFLYIFLFGIVIFHFLNLFIILKSHKAKNKRIVKITKLFIPIAAFQKKTTIVSHFIVHNYCILYDNILNICNKYLFKLID